MTKDGYLAAINFFTARPDLLRLARTIQKTFEITIYIVYPLFLLWLFIEENDFWWKSAAVCSAGFFGVSFLRLRINAKRPFETYEFTPLIEKKKGGNSFPSRHAFCGAIISFNVGVICSTLGTVLGVMTLTIAFLRVILGVHFIRDVVCGILCGVLCATVVLII